MRIAQVAPLYESVPPQLYGGTERVVSYLTEELVEMGHDVTLYASGDSVTQARLVPICPRALRLDPDCIDQFAHHILLLETVSQQADEFDILHFHCDYLHFPLSRRSSTPHVTTLHGRLDLPDLVPLYREFSEMPLVSISYSQRKPLPWANWQSNVYHGLPDSYQSYPQPGTYLAFLGRISPEKGLDSAIEIAKRAGIELRIAAKIDRADRDYFQQVIKPLLDHPLVHLIGEIPDSQKNEFLGNALALVMAIDWPEPFGLTIIEAMACGTPVIAFRRGSVPELLEEGISGYIVDDVAGAAQAVAKVRELDRRRCRLAFDRRFTARRMASDYLAVYEEILQSRVAHGSGWQEKAAWKTSSA
jgi:glycosyltransferase involved in cell wall biosynthesis